jgi:hypothetical protein
VFGVEKNVRESDLFIFGLVRYANCMTAACFRKKAFDGSPISCYCPVYKDTMFLIGAPKGAGKPPCKVTLPYVLSGVKNPLPITVLPGAPQLP